MTAALILAGLILAFRPARPNRAVPPQHADIVQVAELVGLGLTSGMNVPGALAWAASYGHAELRHEIRHVLRQARLHGLAAEMRRAEGRLGGLLGLLARAFETGAALGPTLDGYIEELTSQARADAAARAQRLPVKLLFPLALLMLPGLVLIVAGPALIDVFTRLSQLP
jgi:tight adherence protein C